MADDANWQNDRSGQDTQRRGKRNAAFKRELVEQAIHELWPNGISGTLSNDQITKQVGDWFKRRNIPRIGPRYHPSSGSAKALALTPAGRYACGTLHYKAPKPPPPSTAVGTGRAILLRPCQPSSANATYLHVLVKWQSWRYYLGLARLGRFGSLSPERCLKHSF